MTVTKNLANSKNLIQKGKEKEQRSPAISKPRNGRPWGQSSPVGIRRLLQSVLLQIHWPRDIPSIRRSTKRDLGQIRNPGACCPGIRNDLNTQPSFDTLHFRPVLFSSERSLIRRIPHIGLFLCLGWAQHFIYWPQACCCLIWLSPSNHTILIYFQLASLRCALSATRKGLQIQITRSRFCELLVS